MPITQPPEMPTEAHAGKNPRRGESPRARDQRPPDDPADKAPPVKEPPKDDDIGRGPLPSGDIKEPEPDRKKIAQKPSDEIRSEELLNDPDNLNNQ